MKRFVFIMIFASFFGFLFAEEDRVPSQTDFIFSSHKKPLSAPVLEEDNDVVYSQERHTYIPISIAAKQGIYWGVKTPSWTLASIYFLGELISPVLSQTGRDNLDPIFDFYGCHEKRYRSFVYSNGVKMPLCARCTGISIGVWAGHFDSFIWDSFQIADWERWQQGLLHIGTYSLLLIPMITDGLVHRESYTYVSNNSRRLLTGFFFGYAMTAITDEIFQLVLDYEGDVPRNRKGSKSKK